MKHLCMLFVILACACNDDDTSEEAAALECIDFAYCSTYSVKQYVAAIDPAAGGTIADGTYRLAWAVDPPEADSGSTQQYANAFRIRGGTFVKDYGGRGTLRIDGTKLVFQNTALCSLGKESSTDNGTLEYGFTAMPDRLVLYSQVTSGSKMWLRQYVYLRTEDICRTAPSEPTTPGDSYDCRVTNCVCRAAIGDMINACT